MGLDEMIEAEAQAQAICMATRRLPPRLRGLRRQAQARIRGRLTVSRSLSDRLPTRLASIVAVLRVEPSGLRGAARRVLQRRARSSSIDHRRRRRRVPRARRALGKAGLLDAACRGARRRRLRPSIRARRAWRARRSPGTTASPISPSPCRASAPARSPSPARQSFSASSCRKCARANGLPPSRFRRPTPGRTSPRWPARPSATATITSSTARRPGSRTAGSRTSIVCSRAPARRRAHGGAVGLRGLARRSRLLDRRADRGDRAASAGDAAASRTAAFPRTAMLGSPGEGFKIAMQTLDIFRASVAAAALGFARRALDEAIASRANAANVRGDARGPAADAGGARRDGDRRSTPRRF